MPRFVLAIIVAALSLSASGASSLIVGEPCDGFSLTAEHDADCPPSCVTCGCCAQAAEPSLIAVADSPDALIPDTTAVMPAIPNVDPRSILHVPKPHTA